MGFFPTYGAAEDAVASQSHRTRTFILDLRRGRWRNQESHEIWGSGESESDEGSGRAARGTGEWGERYLDGVVEDAVEADSVDLEAGVVCLLGVIVCYIVQLEHNLLHLDDDGRWGWCIGVEGGRRGTASSLTAGTCGVSLTVVTAGGGEQRRWGGDVYVRERRTAMRQILRLLC